MAGRMTAVKRILLILPLILYTYVMAFIFYVIFIPYFILDVLVQLIAGGDGLPGNSFLDAVYQWSASNTRYVLLGEAEWRWFP